MKPALRRRRVGAVIASVILLIVTLWNTPELHHVITQPTLPVTQPEPVATQVAPGTARDLLAQLDVKGRAPKTDYRRDQFGSGWESVAGCDTRNRILKRDLQSVIENDRCQVVSGILKDPYTGTQIQFERGEMSSQAVQIDHVVALSNAWQTGAQQLTPDERAEFSNDPLNLLAVDGDANQEKSDSDAATWLPPNKAFRCQYVARQIAVKHTYNLWVVPPEKDAMERVLATCPDHPLPQR